MNSLVIQRPRQAGFSSIPLPGKTPWGPIQQDDILMWGQGADHARVPILWQVHTAGHGGTRVHPELAALYFKRLPNECHAYGGSRLWFEEDCESTVPLYIFYNGLQPDCWLVKPPNPFPREKLLESLAYYLADTIGPVRAIAAAFDAHLLAQGIALRAPIPPASA